MNRIQAIILDVAGTCLDFGSCAPVGVFQTVFQNHGVPVSQKEARSQMGKEKREHIRCMLQDPIISNRWKIAHNGQNATDEDIDMMYREMEPIALDILPHFAIPIKGVIDALSLAKKEHFVSLALTSGYNREMLNITLNSAEQNYEFMSKTGINTSIAASEVSLGRPAPYMLFRAMEQLKVLSPKHCIAIGDTVHDIEAGVNAGMWTIGITTGNSLGCNYDEFCSMSKDEQKQRVDMSANILSGHGAHYIINSLSEINDIIFLINEQMSYGARPC